MSIKRKAPPPQVVTWNSPVEFGRAVTDTLVHLASTNPPCAFRPFLNGIVGSVLGRLPDDYFNAMTVIAPCGRAGCDCHLTVQPITIAAWKALRDYRQEHSDKSTVE